MAKGSNEITIHLGEKALAGIWEHAPKKRGIVVFAHGSGSNRFSPRNRLVAGALHQAGFDTLLLDLLDEAEARDRGNIFDIELLGDRMVGVLDWLVEQEDAAEMPIGLFGASTGAAAALRAAAFRPEVVRAAVSRGGRPDLAWNVLPRVIAPTLLIVGECDREVLQLNRSASRHLGGAHELHVIPGATHLFEEAGALDQVATDAALWFRKHLATPDTTHRPSRGFRNRQDAGEQLAAALKKRTLTDPLVLGIPRGGVVLGAILAETLHAELDVVLARKLGMPGNPECALGAISESGDAYFNFPPDEITPSLRAYADLEIHKQTAEIARRREFFRQGHAPASTTGRSVIVTDDGIATGSTMIAALHTLEAQQPQEVIVAVPVASPDRLGEVSKLCDEVVCLINAPDLMSVGQFYQDFRQVQDDEVIRLLRKFAPADQQRP